MNNCSISHRLGDGFEEHTSRLSFCGLPYYLSAIAFGDGWKLSTSFFELRRTSWRSMAGLTRLELATFRVTGGRSNQTELQPLLMRENGSSGRTRTCDLTINSRVLYQLSYRGINFNLFLGSIFCPTSLKLRRAYFTTNLLVHHTTCPP